MPSKQLTFRVLPLAVLLSLPGPASAQESGVNPLFLEEIIVTSRKRSESLQDVPLSISAFDESLLQRRDIRDLQDVAQSTPGLDYENFPTAGLSAAPVIRGMSQTFTTSRIQNTALFLDGIYLQRQSMLNPGLLDMQRIEIVKGPQNALYGRNAFSGAINYISKRPGDEFEGELSVTAGNGDRKEGKVAFGGPLIKDVLAVRGSFAKSEFDGHTDNNHPFAHVDLPGYQTNERVGGWDTEQYSLSAVFTPTEALEITASYFHSEQLREPQAFYFLKGAREGAADLPGGPFGPTPASALNCLNGATFRELGPFTIDLVGNHLHCGEIPYESPADPGLIAGGFLPANATTAGIMVDPRSIALDSKSEILTLGFSYEINNNHSITYQYGDVDHEALDATGVDEGKDSLVGASLGFGFNFSTFNSNPNEELESSSHELRWDWSTSNRRLSGRLGVFQSEVEDSDYSEFYFPAVCNSEASCAQLVATSEVVPGVLPFIDGLLRRPFIGHGQPANLANYKDEIIAVFGDVTWAINDQLSLTVEARYTQEDKEIEQITATFGLPAAVQEDAAGNPVLDANGDEIPVTVPDDTDFSFFTPRITLEWRPNDAQMMYFTAAKGVKTGGFNPVDFDVNPQQAVYNEEENITYEIGSKNRFLDNRLTLNASAYYIDWSDIQSVEAADSTNPFATDVTGNAGDATVIGVELDGVALLSDSFFVDFGFSYTDPEFDNGTFVAAVDDGVRNIPCDDVLCASNGDISGNQLQRTSKTQYNLGLNFRRMVFDDWEFLARLDGNYRSKMYTTPLNTSHNGDRTLYNASINLSNDNWHWTLWGKNITDEEYVANSFFLTQFTRYIVGLGAKRTFGLTAKYYF